ncbi:hypothetical protein BH24ACT25_BH24ACT25_04720 [soil metagenome]
MTDRADIARRHGIEHLADKLVGDTPEALEADAAAKAAIIGMFAPRQLEEEQPEPAEPAVEGLPPADKPVAEWTDEESAAQHASFDRTMRERARREQREAREAEEREQAEANRTDDQRLGDAVVESFRPGVKQAGHAAFLRSLGVLEGDDE